MFHQCSIKIEDAWKQNPLQVLDLYEFILSGAWWNSMEVY